MAKKSLIFASGTAVGGGSGFENLVLRAEEGVLNTNIVGVVSQHRCGGVRKIAARHGIPFYHFGPPWSHTGYVLLARESGAEFFICSGWVKKVYELDPAKTINPHPGPLLFGGKGRHGHHVHKAVMQAYWGGEITHTALCIHFVTKEYDKGPCFFRRRIRIREDDTPGTLEWRVKAVEHYWYPRIANRVLSGHIRWDGTNPDSLVVPEGYTVMTDEPDLPAA